MKNLNYILFMLGLLLFQSCATDEVICDGRIQLETKEIVRFSKNEKKLLCGDKDVKEWQDVPLAQTEATIKEFLKARGYYNFEFALSENGEQLLVQTGTPYVVHEVKFIGAPEEFDDVKYIGWRKKGFTPGTLDEIEGFTIRRLKEIGYACAEVQLQAIVETQIVEVHINAGEKHVFPEIDYDPEVKIKPEVLERYFAFHPGDSYNENLLTLSSRRIESDAVVSKSNFLPNCEDGKLTIDHRVSQGTSRLIQLGAGLSTEEIPIFKASWKDSNVGDNASILSADLYASHLRQVLTLGYEWHAFDANRWYMKPLIEARRIDEVDQEYYNFTGSYSVGTKQDFGPFHLEILSGPAGVFEDAQEGPSIGQKQFALWRNSIILNSHDYEVFMTEPRRGGRIVLESSSIAWSSAGNVHAHWVNVYGTKLWNMFNYGPPKYIFGVRFGAESVMTTAKGDISDSLPQSFFSWLGGDMNLRGFSRREIPFVSTGAQSAAYANFEIRFASLLMQNLDPFVFTDVGMYGLPNFDLYQRLYWSPGFGLRYQSPVGVIRGTMAHGFITGPGNPDHEHFQFFVSLGREF